MMAWAVAAGMAVAAILAGWVIVQVANVIMGTLLGILLWA